MASDRSGEHKADARIAQLREQRPELGGLFDYYRALVDAAERAGGSFRPDLGGLHPEICRRRAAQGRPLLEAGDVVLDGELFDRLMREVIRLSAAHREVLGEEVELPDWPEEGGAGAGAGAGDDLVAGLMGDAAALERAVERAGGSRELFLFLAHQALSPFMRAYAAALADRVPAESWAVGRCPVCGSEPVMARLEEETGKRHLQCGLCATEWAFKRVGCPFCGTEDQEKLRYFCDQRDRGYRVEVCDGCKGYLKTADARELSGELCLPVENLATIHLDMVAQQEGFHREGAGLPAGE
jgi:FdhE protein